jgi:hypothetical protein
MKEHVRSRNWMHNVAEQKESYFHELAEHENVSAGRVNPTVNRRKLGR